MPRRPWPGTLVPPWWRRRSLRARLTVATTVGLGVALLVASLALRVTLRTSLTRGLDSTARQGAQQVASLEADRHLPDPVQVGAGILTIQVLDRRGQIVDASPDVDRMVPLLPPALAAADARGGRAVAMDGRPFGIPYLLGVVAVPVPHGGGVVIAAIDSDQVGASVDTLTRALLVAMPLLLLVLAGATWAVVGSTLRPISALRRGAADVTATSRPRALPVPEAQDEVHDLALTLNDMLDRLSAAQQRQRGLVSDTAHELRNPIASIRTQLEVALDHPDSQDWRETASDVLADTLRLARLAEDLLVLARLDERADRAAPGRAESGSSAPGRAAPDDAAPGRPVDLATLAAEETQRLADPRVTVTTAAGTRGAVLGDADALRRVLVNLVENALRHTRSQVDVNVSTQDDRVLLTVTDDGPGIAAPDRERVFGRFVRLDAARSRDGENPGGAGLGLAIVRATAQAHGGSAWLEDASPGLHAVVSLPAGPPTAGPPPATSLLTSPHAVTPHPTGEQGR